MSDRHLCDMAKVSPRCFSGEVDAAGRAEDPSAWLDHFKLVSTVNGWIDDELKLRNAPVYFTKEAEDWYAVHRRWTQDENRSWREFREEFINRFRPANFQEELEERVRTPMM